MNVFSKKKKKVFTSISSPISLFYSQSKGALQKKKKRSSLLFHPQFPYFIPKIKMLSKKKKKKEVFTSILFPKSRCSLKKKKGLHFDSLIIDFLFCSRNQTLPMLMQRKHVLPKLTQCAAKQKYCSGFSSLLCGRAGAQLRGNIVYDVRLRQIKSLNYLIFTTVLQVL